MSRLPYDEKLNIGYLSRLFDDTSNCYKFFWFQAILGKLSEDKTSFTYDELIKNVPYRIQVPFFDEIKIDKREWSRPEQLSQKINQQRSQ